MLDLLLPGFHTRIFTPHLAGISCPQQDLNQLSLDPESCTISLDPPYYGTSEVYLPNNPNHIFFTP